MSTSAINLEYKFIPPVQSETNEPITTVTNPTIATLYNSYNALFGANGTYAACLSEIYRQLNEILGYSTNHYNASNLDDVYKDTRKINNVAIDSVCREGYMAYLFYVKTIVEKIQTLETYIKMGQEALAKLQALPNVTQPDGTTIVLDEDEKIRQHALVQITDLDIYNDIVYDVFKSFLEYYKYDKDTHQWENILPNTLDSSNYQQSQLAAYSAYKNLGDLRNTLVAYTDVMVANPKQKLTIFNTLNLMDRYRYIQYYYKLILQGNSSGVKATDYQRFPDDADTGFPCLPDTENIVNQDIKDTQDIKKMGALELFYIGYLSNRDGPINAVASFFEVKYQALQGNIELVSQKISALNIYLTFLNRGMDLLNNSQTNGKKRIPDGANIALTYLAGGNMFNLFKDANGEQHLVIESKKNPGTYMLVKADESGMKFLMGDDASANNYKGNGYVGLLAPTDANNGTKYWILDGYDPSRFSAYPTVSYYDNGSTTSVSGFFKPTRLDVATVLPNSAKSYESYTTPAGKDEDWTSAISSWSNAFSNKTQFINTAIDTYNTDVTVDRSKMDTFSSLASTFRSRAQDTYTNIASNIGR